VISSVRRMTFMKYTYGHSSHEQGQATTPGQPSSLRTLAVLLLCAGVFLTLSCSSQSSSGSGGTGSVSFSLKLPGQGGAVHKAADIDCWGLGIASIQAAVYDEDGNLLAEAGPWDCDTGVGTISGVKAGQNRSIVVTCLNVSGNVSYRGETGEVEVIEHGTTDAGTIGVGSVVTNTAPALSAMSFTDFNGSPLSFTFDGTYATDMDGDNLSFDIADLPDGATFDPATGVFEWLYCSTGDYLILCRVTDDGTPPLSAYQEVPVHILPGASALQYRPVLTLTPAGPLKVHDGDVVAITLSGSDDNENALTYSIQTVPGKTNVPGTASIDGSNVFHWDTADATAGNYYVRFRVTDNSASILTDEQDVTITVGNVNRPPVLTPIGERTVTAGQTLTFPVTGTDPDCDSLSYTLGRLGDDYNYPTGAAIASGQFSWTPTSHATYHLRVHVRDNGSPQERDFEDVTITVTP
jgi:hypothetical protein